MASGSIEQITDIIISVVPMFTGIPASSAQAQLSLFFDAINAVYPYLSEEEQEIFLNFLPHLRLRGEAYELCKNRSFATLNEFRECLNSFYCSNKDLLSITAEMVSCIQNFDETVLQFGERIRGILTDYESYLYELMGPASNNIIGEFERLALKTFRKGILTATLRNFAHIIGDVPLKELIQRVSQMEKSENLETETLPPCYITQSVTYPTENESLYIKKFQMVSENPQIVADGLLGNNFLARNCNVEGPSNFLSFPITENNPSEFKIPLVEYGKSCSRPKKSLSKGASNALFTAKDSTNKVSCKSPKTCLEAEQYLAPTANKSSQENSVFKAKSLVLESNRVTHEDRLERDLFPFSTASDLTWPTIDFKIQERLRVENQSAFTANNPDQVILANKTEISAKWPNLRVRENHLEDVKITSPTASDFARPVVMADHLNRLNAEKEAAFTANEPTRTVGNIQDVDFRPLVHVDHLEDELVSSTTASVSNSPFTAKDLYAQIPYKPGKKRLRVEQYSILTANDFGHVKTDLILENLNSVTNQQVHYNRLEDEICSSSTASDLTRPVVVVNQQGRLRAVKQSAPTANDSDQVKVTNKVEFSEEGTNLRGQKNHLEDGKVSSSTASDLTELVVISNLQERLSTGKKTLLTASGSTRLNTALDTDFPWQNHGHRLEDKVVSSSTASVLPWPHELGSEWNCLNAEKKTALTANDPEKSEKSDEIEFKNRAVSRLTKGIKIQKCRPTPLVENTKASNTDEAHNDKIAINKLELVSEDTQGTHIKDKELGKLNSDDYTYSGNCEGSPPYEIEKNSKGMKLGNTENHNSYKKKYENRSLGTQNCIVSNYTDRAINQQSNRLTLVSSVLLAKINSTNLLNDWSNNSKRIWDPGIAQIS